MAAGSRKRKAKTWFDVIREDFKCTGAKTSSKNLP